MAATIASRSARGTNMRRPAARRSLSARESLRAPQLAELARLDDASFRALFTKSPVKRTGRDRFIRNVLIAIGNSGDVALASDAERLLDDASPLVRGAAVWALSRLDPARLAAHAGRFERETDPAVREEWAQRSRRRDGLNGDAALPRPRLLRALLRRRVRRALRPHHRDVANAEARGRGRDAGVRCRRRHRTRCAAPSRRRRIC